MMLGYNNYSTITHHPHNSHYKRNRSRPQQHSHILDDTSNHYNSAGGGSSFHSTHSTPTPTTTTTTTTPSPHHAFDDNSLRAAAASAIGINSQSLNQVPDLMPSDSWLVHSQHTPTAAQRLGHQRESSLSSLGSTNGPASPYNSNISNPQIAVSDSGNDGFHELNSGDSAYSYQLGKHMPENFYTNALASYNAKNQHRNVNNVNNNGHGHTAMTTNSFADGLPNLSPSVAHVAHVAQPKPRGDRGLAPAPELSASGGSSSRHAVSVASSTAGDDSPATPSLQEPEDDVRRPKNGENSDPDPDSDFLVLRYLSDVDGGICLQSFSDDAGFNHNLPPKLDRTLTDIYTDELYNPNFTFTSASPPQTVAMSPSNDVFAQRLHAANSQHLSAVQSPNSSTPRDRSPFRQCSPYASTADDFTQMGMNQARLGSAHHMREKRKAEQDAREIQHQMARNAARQHGGTPHTISPKDAVLDFNEPDDGSNFPLFSPHETHGFKMEPLSHGSHAAIPQQPQQHQTNQSFRSMSSATPVQSAFNFSMPSSVHMPQQYPFVARSQHDQHPQETTPSASSFSRVSSADIGTPDYSEGSMQKPAGTKADSGTYTCTYHGCSLRFETPALLQKHKREGHRQATTLNAIRSSPVPGMTSSLLNSQAGPHKCERINPSTGKPCNTVFSRPYDLTRHEDTIHNARKQKVRCNLCTEEKTFSRADALTRHYRVCHPDVEFPGKHRRRGGNA